MSIKYGITEWGLPGRGRFAVKYTAEAGLDGLQIELGSYDEGFFMGQKEIRDDYMRDAEKYGVEFPSIVLNDVNKYGFVHTNRKESCRIAFASVDLAIDVAIKMGISDVMVPHFFENEIVDDKTMDAAIKGLKIICEKAGEKGLHIQSESLLPPEKVKELFEGVNMPNISHFYDSQNYYFFKNYDQKEMIEGMYPFMGTQLHVKDCIGQYDKGGVLSGAMLGKGDSNLMASINFLNKKSYSGWVIIENYYYVKPLSEQRSSQLEALKDDVKYLKKII